MLYTETLHTNLGDPVVVGQEHREVLGLLDGLWVGHLSQELSCPGAVQTQQC